MTSKGLGEMFEVDFANTCATKFPLMLMGSEDLNQREQKLLTAYLPQLSVCQIRLKVKFHKTLKLHVQSLINNLNLAVPS